MISAHISLTHATSVFILSSTWAPHFPPIIRNSIDQQERHLLQAWHRVQFVSFLYSWRENDDISANDIDKAITYLLVGLFAGGNVIKMNERLNFNKKNTGHFRLRTMYTGPLYWGTTWKCLEWGNRSFKKCVVSCMARLVRGKAVDKVKPFLNGIGPRHS